MKTWKKNEIKQDILMTGNVKYRKPNNGNYIYHTCFCNVWRRHAILLLLPIIDLIQQFEDYVKYYRVQIVHVKQKHISQDIKKKEVASFIGFNNSHLYPIKTFSELAEPLHRLTGTRNKFEWGEDQESAFQSINKDNNKITELRTILQRESHNS